MKRRLCLPAASVLVAMLLPTTCKPNATSASHTSNTTQQVEDRPERLPNETAPAVPTPEPPSAAPDAEARAPDTEIQTTGNDGETRRRLWRTGRFVCVHEADTTQVSQAEPPEPVGSCKNWPGDDAVEFAQSRAMCGPCGFWLDAEQTRRERATTADACCYLVSSPPPPPPPPTPPHD